MKAETKIAFTYTFIITGVIALLTVVFFFIANGYINRLDIPDSEQQLISSIRQNLGWMLLGFIIICSLLVYLVGRHYTQRMITRIESAYQSEKAFVRSASHELNNPLTAIQGECEITLLKERTPDEYKAALGRISFETKRIISLMKNLLFLSRGDKDILDNSVEPVLLAEFLMKFVENKVSFSPDHFSFTVHANPYLLKMALENIISNSCKYSGDKKVEIRLRGNVLEIEDQGIGIPPEELEHIFQPFFRASNTREIEGHGIGLSLALRILKAYGAQVFVFSELNKGTTVRIIFQLSRTF